MFEWDQSCQEFASAIAWSLLGRSWCYSDTDSNHLPLDLGSDPCSSFLSAWLCKTVRRASSAAPISARDQPCWRWDSDSDSFDFAKFLSGKWSYSASSSASIEGELSAKPSSTSSPANTWPCSSLTQGHWQWSQFWCLESNWGQASCMCPPSAGQYSDYPLFDLNSKTDRSGRWYRTSPTLSSSWSCRACRRGTSKDRRCCQDGVSPSVSGSFATRGAAARASQWWTSSISSSYRECSSSRWNSWSTWDEPRWTASAQNFYSSFSFPCLWSSAIDFGSTLWLRSCTLQARIQKIVASAIGPHLCHPE